MEQLAEILTLDRAVRALGLLVVAAPAGLFALLSLPTLLGRPISERAVGRLVQTCVWTGLAAAVGMLAFMLWVGTRRVPIALGTWVDIPHYHFSIKFVFDRLSVPLVILSLLLCGAIGAFASKYMHRESGFTRFFVLYALFLLGMVVTALAGTIETLFAGWELVGLSSALLVAFFHERPAPCRNGLHVWVVYRVSDAALLLASVVLHHVRGGGDFSGLLGMESWPEGHVALEPYQALAIGLLLVLAAAGKSALVPLSGWLPRAMEGPTPSSAVFYGALSVHLGAFLLLRMGPLLDQSPTLCALVVLLGLSTAGFAAVAGRVHSDIKTVLSLASLTQVGLIVAEIGLGLRYLALIHIVGHGCLRTLQFLRAPSLLQDFRQLENALGQSPPAARMSWFGRATARFHAAWYRMALERGHLDAWLGDCLVRPLWRVLQGCERLERAWIRWLSGESQPVPRASAPAVEDLA